MKIKKGLFTLILVAIASYALSTRHTKGSISYTEKENSEAQYAETENQEAQAEGANTENEGQDAEAENTTAASESASAQTISVTQSLEIPQYTSSRGGQVLRRVGYTLSYDADYKTPQWVGWTLTKAKAEGTEPRAKHFDADPDIRGAKAYPDDYKNSGYDRGHMAPAGDMKWSKQAMKESFLMSNICPQNQNLNRGDWKELEEKERDWALKYDNVVITAGPIYQSKKPQRIGNNKVAVPDAFFKVLLVNYPRSPKAYGFIFPNQAGNHPLTYYQLTVDEVEKATGMDFFSSLPDKVESRVEAERPAL